MYKTKEQFEEELKKRFPNNSVEILDYTKASGAITYKCNDCGKIYRKSKANHLYENKTLCAQCYTGKTSKLREAFLAKNGIDYIILDNLNKPLNKKFHIKCLKCGEEYDYKIQQVILEGFNCRYCGKNGFPVTQEIFEKRLNAITAEFTVIKYKNFTKSVVLQHNCGYKFSTMPFNFLKSCNCPKCKPKRSKGEQKIYEWLINKELVFEEQKKFQELGNLSYDFFVPSLRLLIEYQGQQHFRPITYFGGEEKFKIQMKHDLLKEKYAKDNNYTLLLISYKDYEKIEKILEGSTTKVG